MIISYSKTMIAKVYLEFWTTVTVHNMVGCFSLDLGYRHIYVVRDLSVDTVQVLYTF